MRLLHEEEIPKQLLEIPEPPKKLYIEGTMPLPGSVYLAIVGSRKYTIYGKDVCQKLIAGLKGYPIIIVSGLALGMDTIAHQCALANGITTVAFPGSGLDASAIYPSSNRLLAQQIIKSGGALISEFEPKVRGDIWTFPRRNRLMAGIARAVLIIEAADKSGTLITARLATDYNRDVLVVPGSIFSENAKGTNSLLRLGATPITNSQELLQALGFDVETNTEAVNRELADASPEEREILELLRDPTPRDELIRNSDKSASELNALLTIMEIKGLIKEELGEIRRM